jgi:hypothetical protein
MDKRASVKIQVGIGALLRCWFRTKMGRGGWSSWQLRWAEAAREMGGGGSGRAQPGGGGSGCRRCLLPCCTVRETGEGDPPTGGPLQSQQLASGCHTRFLCQNHVLIVCMTQNQLFHTYGPKVFTDNQMS